MLNEDTLVVRLHGDRRRPSRRWRKPDGAAKVQEFHRQLFLNASDVLQQEIKRITGMDVAKPRWKSSPRPAL